MVLEIKAKSEYPAGMIDLRTAREAVDLSQQALADLVGTSQPQIDRLEKGARKLTIEWAKKLAPHLGVKALDLLPLDDGKEKISSEQRNSRYQNDHNRYDNPVVDDPNREVEGMQADKILAAIGRLTVEIEGLKAEVKEIKESHIPPRPGSARRK